MENREILIANTNTQKRYKLTTGAETLGELKVAMAEAGIEYGSLEFTEGISKTKLLDDASQLPKNIMYKGNVTNNLVILLTNTKKNIESGIPHPADRKAAYSIIKENNLQQEVINKFGRNFTQVSTNDLVEFINSLDDAELSEEPKTDTTSCTDSDDITEDDVIEIDVNMNTVRGNLVMLVGNLIGDKVLTRRDLAKMIDDLKGILDSWDEGTTPSEPVETTDGSINDNDIDDMIEDLGV